GFLNLEKYGLTLPVSSTTTHKWMVKLGCKFDRASQSYYTDGHERSDVVKYREEYVRAKRRHALRQPCWAQIAWDSLTCDQQKGLEKLEEEGEETPYAEVFRYKDDKGDQCVEIHVDFLGDDSDKHDALRRGLGEERGRYSVRFDKAAEAPCEFHHETTVCKCGKELRHAGQDESCYRCYALSSTEWVVRGARGLRKKTPGLGEMVSAIQCEVLGFGVDLVNGTLAKVNEFRKSVGRPELTCSPGLRFIEYGKNRDGYWGFKEFEEQVVDYMDVFEVMYPEKQLMLEVDHSAGYAKYREDGLHVGHMNFDPGGCISF
ncbi:unnamed protein product, partial [Sphacelaria rigidula]